MVRPFLICVCVAGALLTGLAAKASAAVQDPHAIPAIQLAPDGLRLLDSESGEAARLGFGTPQDDAVEAVAAALGAPESSSHNEDCDAGPLHIVDFQGGLRLYFRAGEFAGWNTDGGWSSGSGIAAGMSYRDLAAAARELEAEETSLGMEFRADGLNGLLSEGGEAGTVTSLWAGVVCSMR